MIPQAKTLVRDATRKPRASGDDPLGVSSVSNAIS